MNATSASDRLKKVLRIALVGIKPGDQVMLKGYLRILLRLEADLEWVSANNQQIDLFMVNHDFRHSDSVQKLINNNPNTATIYTSRSESEAGYLTQDLLVLPLKDLDPLNEWLFAQVPLLSGQSASSGAPVNNATPAPASKLTSSFNASASQTQRLAASQPTQTGNASLGNSLSTYQAGNQAAQTTAATNSDTHNFHQKLANFNNSMSAPNNGNASPSFAINDNYLLGFAKIFSQIQQRQDEILSIKSPAGTLFAYINPKQQRVWQISEYISSNQPWIISGADDASSQHLDVKAAKNMVQWLWLLSTKHAEKLEGLLNSQTKYHIDTWVKPLHDAEQHDHLKIQCVLEARSMTIDELVTRSQCSLPQVKKTLMGLFIAGAFPASVYQQTIDQLSGNMSTASLQPSTQAEITEAKKTQAEPFSASMAAQPINAAQPVVTFSTTQSSMQEIPSLPSASQPSQTHTQVHTPTQPTSQPQSKLDEILSRRAMAEASSTNMMSNAPSTASNNSWDINQAQAESTSATSQSMANAAPTSTSASLPTQHTSQPASSETQDTGNNGMMGFLGRLRRRLGL